MCTIAQADAAATALGWKLHNELDLDYLHRALQAVEAAGAPAWPSATTDPSDGSTSCHVDILRRAPPLPTSESAASNSSIGSSRVTEIATPRGLRAEWLAREAEARGRLEEAEIPPCYPPEVELPGAPHVDITLVPNELRNIVTYFYAKLGDVLYTQWVEWEQFRRWQWQQRRRRGKDRSRIELERELESEVRERRRLHGLGEVDVRLRYDWQQQTRLENWIEFQDYQLFRHEKLQEQLVKDKELVERERDPQTRAQRALEKIPSDPVRAYYTDLRRAEEHLQSSERSLGFHKLLLDWVEQQRTRMAAEQLQPLGDKVGADMPRTLRRSSRQQRPNRQHHRPQVTLGNSGISKPVARRRKAVPGKGSAPGINGGSSRPRCPTCDRPAAGAESSKSETRPRGSDVRSQTAPAAVQDPSPPRTQVSARRSRRQKKSETRGDGQDLILRRQVGSSKVSKVARLTPSKGERAMPRRKGLRVPRLSASAPVVDVLTRSGRVSRRPVRWVPGMDT